MVPHERPKLRRQAPGGARRLDRRTEPRVGECPPVRVFGLPAVVYDVSRHGISLLIEDGLTTGECRRLILQDTLDGSTQDLPAEVVWVRRGRAGLRWLEAEGQGAAWLAHRFQVWLQLLDGASRR